MFKAGSTIRDLITGKLYLVIQSFKYAVLVGSLESREILNDGKYIYQRDWERFAPDVKLERRIIGNDQYIYNQVSL